MVATLILLAHLAHLALLAHLAHQILLAHLVHLVHPEHMVCATMITIEHRKYTFAKVTYT